MTHGEHHFHGIQYLLILVRGHEGVHLAQSGNLVEWHRLGSRLMPLFAAIDSCLFQDMSGRAFATSHDWDFVGKVLCCRRFISPCVMDLCLFVNRPRFAVHYVPRSPCENFYPGLGFESIVSSSMPFIEVCLVD